IERATKWQKSAFADGIDECGADALRFSLVNYTTGGGDIAFDVKVMRSWRNFCNKIYQATKFVLGNLPEDFTPRAQGGKTGKESLPERWILHKMNAATKSVNEALEKREFSRATQALHQYWLYELCDVYIENSKSIIKDGNEEGKRSAINTLYTSLETALTLMHPFMPFLTEELWQRLPRRPEDKTKSIVIAKFPQYSAQLDDPESERIYDLVLGCSKGIRSLLQELGVKENGAAFTLPLTDSAHATATAETVSIRSLGGKALSTLTVLSPSSSPPKNTSVYPVDSSVAVLLQLPDGLEASKVSDKVKAKLEKSEEAVARQEKAIKTIGGEAGKEVKEREEARLKDLEMERKLFGECLERLGELKI
ncbi:hypothetical protein LTR95_008446, partial [Oleoguttula sp. CCFEE 5521]